MKHALITGITGQDGAYMAELLLQKGYSVFGLLPRRSLRSFGNLDWLNVREKINFIEGDITDLGSMIRAVTESQPDEVYNFAAQSFVGTSWKQPVTTMNTTGMGAVNVLDAVRLTKPDARFYQASTSEMFGLVNAKSQNEETPFYPRSPYGFAKLMAHWATVNYCESYDMFAVSGILFNHESPCRGPEFVTRKITMAAARIALGSDERLKLGNLDAQRDWGFAGDYVHGIHAMLNHTEPETFVLATGESNSVRDVCGAAFSHFGLNWEDHVVEDEEFIRPAEIPILCGDATKARTVLGWEPKVKFAELISGMAYADYERELNAPQS